MHDHLPHVNLEECMAELTAFGKEVRKLRIDKEVSLMEMADALGVSVAFLSALETGRKNPPQDFVTIIGRYFRLDRARIEALHVLALQSSSIVRLRPQTRNREVAAEFARKFDSLGEADIKKILQILRGSKGE